MPEKHIVVYDEHAETVENALDAVDGDPELPDVSRGRGRAAEDEIPAGEALAKVAEAYTGWSA